MTDIANAQRFLMAEARLLERRLYQVCFSNGGAEAVIDAVRAYRNPDGGFGHGLEPDKRTPDSLPIDVETAFQALAAAGAADPALLGPACDFLARVADERGAVPLAFPVIEAYPRAGHWSEWTYEPGLNPTAGLVGLLYRLGFAHPWRERAAGYCWDRLEAGALPEEVHALAETLVFLEYAPDRDRAERHAAAVLERLVASETFHLDPAASGYGLSPLVVAPAAGSRWRRLFTAEQLDGHLDRLAADQQPDGGWPITWEPPGVAARQEWRGIVTLQALRTLRSYGRA
ncbi:hypothetical protein Asp14428_69090 [Actinoplanes sp. NBRC 14428]|nr:hypothetical protein Asp14428_69090 [Actinoplanes sp. NBRC 14428]